MYRTENQKINIKQCKKTKENHQINNKKSKKSQCQSLIRLLK